jgi:hypothetical protein
MILVSNLSISKKFNKSIKKQLRKKISKISDIWLFSPEYQDIIIKILFV